MGRSTAIIVLLSALVLLSGHTVWAAECHGQHILNSKGCDGDGLSPEEARLHRMVNQYRAVNRLPPIPLSPSLNLVANRHIRDVDENGELFTRGGRNWLHGWSDCAYDAANPETFSCMWDAPKRLETFYPGSGFEIFCGSPDVEYSSFRMTAEYALRTWQRSPLHNSVLLNKGVWKNRRWKAMGIGIHEGYAAIWFGAEPDPANQAGAPVS